MAHTIVTQEDDNLTAIAKHIFGAIVERAYITTWYYGDTVQLSAATHEEVNDIRERLKREVFGEAGSIMFLDAHHIIIKFTNGNSVKLAASELCTICKVDLEKGTVNVDTLT